MSFCSTILNIRAGRHLLPPQYTTPPPTSRRQTTIDQMNRWHHTSPRKKKTSFVLLRNRTAETLTWCVRVEIHDDCSVRTKWPFVNTGGSVRRPVKIVLERRKPRSRKGCRFACEASAEVLSQEESSRMCIELRAVVGLRMRVPRRNRVVGKRFLWKQENTCLFYFGEFWVVFGRFHRTFKE